MKLCNDVRLRICERSGEGEIVVSDDWHDQDHFFRADVLRDWIGDLAGLYSDALLDMGRPNATGVQFIELTEEYFSVMRGEKK
jgi:hypothetical protein